VSVAVIESLIVLALIAVGYAREKTCWRRADASVTAALVVFAFVTAHAALVTASQYLLLLSLLFLNSSLHPLHRGSGGRLAQHRLTAWIARALSSKKRGEEEQEELKAKLIDLAFKLLSVGIWLYGITLVSDGLVFRLMTAISICVVVNGLFEIALTRRMDVFDRRYKDAHAAKGLAVAFLVIASLSIIAAISNQLAWIPCASFLAAWAFHFYLLRKFVGPTRKSLPVGNGTFLLKPEGFITTGSAGNAAHRLSLLVFIAYAVGLLNLSPPMLRTFLLTVSGVAGGVLAVVTMLGILALQAREDIGMSRSLFARGLQGFALSFIVLLGASLAAALVLPVELPDAAHVGTVAGSQTLLALTLLIYVLMSLPHNLVYFLSLVWDVLRPVS